MELHEVTEMNVLQLQRLRPYCTGTAMTLTEIM